MRGVVEGAAIIAGGVFQGMTAVYKNKADQAGSYDEFLDRVQKKKQFQVGAIAGFAAGAITAGIGVTQLVLWSKRRKALAEVKAKNPVIEKCDSGTTAATGAESGAATDSKTESGAETKTDDTDETESEDSSKDVEAEASVALGGVYFSLRF